MTDGEFEKIKLLLKQFYVKHPFWQEQTSQYAYKLALQPYAYEDVKAAILRHVRRSNAFPFVGELTASLALTEETEKPAQIDEMEAKHTRDVIAKYGSWGAYMETLQGWIDELRER